MNALAVLILAMVLSLAAPSSAADILVVQSMRDSNFSDVLKGFRSVCSATYKTIVLSDYTDVDIFRIVKEEHPSLVVTLGESAYASVKKVRRTPIVSLMSLALSMRHQAPPNVTGVGMVAHPDQYMKVFGSMRAKRVGVVYNPRRSTSYLNSARRAAERADLDLVALEVRDPREVPNRLALLKGRVDALWLVPDTTAISPATTEAYFLFSMQEWKPVVAFSTGYLHLGASVAVDIDRFGMGRQGGEMANRLLNGASPSEIPFQDPALVVIKQNQPLNQKLGVRLNFEPFAN